MFLFVFSNIYVVYSHSGEVNVWLCVICSNQCMLCSMVHSLEGKGTYTFPTDTKYEGEFKDGMFHGKGTLFFHNGSKYEATWEDGIAMEVTWCVEFLHDNLLTSI